MRECCECGFSGQAVRLVRERPDGTTVHVCADDDVCSENKRMSEWADRLLVEANEQDQYEAGNALWAV